MAGGEIYRVEIPIIVDDQTDAPLKQAESKISKFEKSAQMETKRIRKHLQHIAKLQVEPVMKVRDHLTANVLKADKLIRKLDVAQASPLIAAQDRVSVVVTRINAMLDALDKGKVDVIADMKGPLLDEIVKAKSALAVLNNVKAGPIAELRGELFGQLTKAMSQIKGLDLTRAEPQATLRERVIWKVKEISSSLRGLTSRAWNVTLQVKDKVTRFVSGLVNKLTSPLALLGAGAGLGAGIIYPLKLAGEFEQAQMSLDYYMGSVEEGKRAFQDLIRFAKETPFEFPFLQGATIQLMGTGYNFEQAKRALLAFGDAAGRTGAGMQGIEAALLGFTQIASAGTLNLQDLKQVALNLKLPLNIFARELGVAESELGDIGRAGISSKKAMEAIVRTLEQRFAGGMKELSRSLLGMAAVIKDTVNLTVWHFGKGMAEPVKRIMFDIIGMTEDSSGGFEEFQKRIERAGERVGRKFHEMYKGAKRFFRDLANTPGFNKMTWSEKVAVALDKILETVSAWLRGPGGEVIKKTGEILGRLLAAGLEGAIPNIVPVGVELGKALGGAVVQGIFEAIKASPWAGILLGAYAGFRIAGPKGAAIGAGIGALAWGLPKGFEALGKHIPGTEYYARERIEEYKRAKQMFEERKAVTPAGEPLLPGTELRAMPKRAIGGIYSKPHTALVAEAGPEVIIPLSTRMRNRALGLWEEAGRRLGARPYAEGGFAGSLTQNPVGLTPSLSMAGPAAINLNFDLTGLVGQVVIESREDIDGAVDRIADAIANNLRSVFQNMTK